MKIRHLSVYNIVCLRFFIFAVSSHIDDPGKYKKPLCELIERSTLYKIQSYIKRPARFPHRSMSRMKRKEKVSSNMRKTSRRKNHHLGVCSPSMHSVVCSDSASARAYLSLRCPIMPIDTFSLSTARMMKRE